MLTFFKRLHNRLLGPRTPTLMGEPFTIESAGPNGERLFYFYDLDAWFWCVPGQGARRVYIGQDDEFNIEVLEIKSGFQRLRDAYIIAFEEVRAIYIDPANPFVGLTSRA